MAEFFWILGTLIKKWKLFHIGQFLFFTSIFLLKKKKKTELCQNKIISNKLLLLLFYNVALNLIEIYYSLPSLYILVKERGKKIKNLLVLIYNFFFLKYIQCLYIALKCLVFLI